MLFYLWSWIFLIKAKLGAFERFVFLIQITNNVQTGMLDSMYVFFH